MEHFNGLVGAFRGLKFIDSPKAHATIRSHQSLRPLPPSIPTSAHTLLSSLHGRDRRLTRNIGKRDLQAAVKYGKKEATYPNRQTGAQRWKYTYKNIVYITEGSRGTKEVTSYVEPVKIPEAFVTAQDLEVHNRLSEKLKKQPSLVTSHTIFIVDQSGSMKNNDVEQYRTRSDAVFGTLALDFVGKQIEGKHVHHTDCASLVLMRDTAEVAVFREPVDNVLYNKLIKQQKEKPYSHGNYIPALQLAKQLAKMEAQNPNCAVLLLFLSDGRPSDYALNNEQERSSFFSRLESIISEIAKPLLGRLVFGAIGFADNADQFDVLKHMVKCFTKCRTMGSFQHVKGGNLHTLSAAISTLSSSLVQSRATLTNLAGSSSRTLRNLQKEKPENFHSSSAYPNNDWQIYQQQSFQRLKRWVWSDNDSQFVEEHLDQSNLNVSAVAIKKMHFGDGAERVVYSLRELVRARGRYSFVGQKLVAKECKYVEDERLKLKFHETFCKTQMQAQKIAQEFNKRMSVLKKLHPYLVTANIAFLDCWVYTMFEDEHYERGVLCEKYLDHTKYKKWNSNNGYVAALQTVKENEQLHVPLDVILEESSDEEESSSDDDEIISTKKFKVTTDDYPQAFSHFSYRSTKRKMIVCDLQGVFDATAKPPLFEMTDPVIHYASSRDGKKQQSKFGRTDLGEKGINNFFSTHKCNDLCNLLGLEGDNPTK